MSPVSDVLRRLGQVPDMIRAQAEPGENRSESEALYAASLTPHVAELGARRSP